MRKDNYGVAKRWAENLPSRNGRNTLWTDGKDLYSYRLRIGFTSEKGTKVVIDHRAPHFVSITTSAHVGIAGCFAKHAIHPDYEPT
jgi:hypothetical protein